MIDDFARPQSGRIHNRPRNKEAEEDFFPDLSSRTHDTEQSYDSDPPQQAAQDTFKTPQEIAEEEDVIDDTIDLSSGDEQDEDKTPAPIPSKSDYTPPKPPKERWWKRLKKWFSNLNKKQKALVILLLLVLMSGIGYGAYTLLKSDETPVKKVTQKKKEQTPTTVPSNLTGLPVAPELNKKPVTGVMVENSVDARPQAGLADAGIVFEAIAEGGITRFLALYQDTDAESVGPIRSIRPYYIDWGLGFDAAFAHVGGSPDALNRIRSEKVKDLDQSQHAQYFQRVSSRFAPHNVFTPTTRLGELEKSKDYNESSYTPLTRKKEAPSPQPNAQTINLNISSQKFNVQYGYNIETNSYARSMAGVAHVDTNNNQQITAKVVVAMVMNYSISRDGVHSVYNTTGSGKVYIFQDGIATEGTWEKTSPTSQITFKDANGTAIGLNPGKTWITAVNNTKHVRYLP